MIGSLTVWGLGAPPSGAVHLGGGGDMKGGGGGGLHKAQAQHQGDQGGPGGAGQVTVEGRREAVHGRLLGCGSWVCLRGCRKRPPSLVIYFSRTLLKCQAISPSVGSSTALESEAARRV